MRAVLVLLLAVSPVAVAAGTPSQQALQKWRKAVGSAKVQSVVLRGGFKETGFQGKVDTWLDGKARKRVTTYEGARFQEDVLVGGEAWRKDWNGHVEELVGRDLTDAVTVAAIESFLYRGALDGLDPASAEAGEDGAIRFHPKGGVPVDLSFDAASGLPRKAVRKVKHATVEQVFSDWRPVGGLKVPFAIHEGEDSATVLDEVLPSRKPAAVAFTRPQDGAPDHRFAEGSQALAIPFNFENEHVMVKGRINDAGPLWFMIDTGAAVSVVNKTRLEEMGLRSIGSTSILGGGGETGFAYADVPRLQVGGASLLRQRVGVMDLSGLERLYGMAMGGILGYDFVSRFVVRVNYDTSTVDLLDPKEFVYRGSGTPVPFVMQGERPYATATLTVPDGPPMTAELVVDSGAAGTVNLNTPFVQENHLLERARKTPAGKPSTFAGSEKEFFAQSIVSGKLTGFALPPFTLKDVPVSLMVQTSGAYASAHYAGVIGQGVLQRFNQVYDYGRSTMILEPREDLAKPFPPRRGFGVTLLADGPDYTTFTVTGVTPKTPAEAAGLKKGDVVTAVDGKPASELRLADVRRLLLEDGAHRVLDVRRGEETVTLDFTVAVLTAKDE
ncbi:MAG TPA: aspartyl protease family protein [Candidatus Polarisedimenticolaceae bacterium]|nr:aspartyl protease family protein [Candidatus Polarisedimenticolaceae bacterium]